MSRRYEQAGYHIVQRGLVKTETGRARTMGLVVDEHTLASGTVVTRVHVGENQYYILIEGTSNATSKIIAVTEKFITSGSDVLHDLRTTLNRVRHRSN